MKQITILLNGTKLYSCVKTGILLCSNFLFFQSCTTYSLLPENISNYSEIKGIYSNNSKVDTTSAWREARIWQLLDYKREIREDSLFVKIDIIDTKSLKIMFLRNDEKIGEKQIKGKFRDDNCFYTRRKFYIIPILPILWGYSNEQKRIYRVDDLLAIETTYNYGGVFIIMAGGDKSNRVRLFERKTETIDTNGK